MSDKAPTFAVVGRVNEGKSSIVASLVEDDRIEIGPEPGTTRVAAPYVVEEGGEALFSIVDTPGFQEPEAAFAWLSARARTAAERPAAIRAFLAEFEGRGRFEDEVRLLRPVMDGASVLYVVDASHPFRASYEYEMQILRWTGRPCFALVNRTSARDFGEEWKTALKQYFNAVRPFNAQQNRFEERLSLLTMLAELDDEARPTLLRAIDVLRRRQARRYERAAELMADAVLELVSYRLSEPSPVAGVALLESEKRRLEERFHAEVARREARAREAIEAVFAHRRIARVESELTRPLFDRDIFSEETWRLLGLSRARLVAAGALGGAIVGGAIDAMVAGHSFLLGTVIGGGVGAASAAMAAAKGPEARVLGITISQSELEIGPHQSPNFAWIVLDRALMHFAAIVARSHAAQDALTLTDAGAAQDGGKRGIAQTLSKTRAARLELVFRAARKGRVREAERETLRRALGEILPTL